MPPITVSPVREIVSNFVQEIKRKQLRDQKPSKAKIRFRNDMQDNKERDC